MATVMSRNSTIVRNALSLASVRTGFRIGATFAPRVTASIAARMFSTPSAVARTRALQADAGDAQCRTLDIDGERVAVYVWGDPSNEPYVVLAHGWSSYALRFHAWIAPLRAAGFAVVAFDQIGHGRSTGQRATLPQFAQTLTAVVDAYGPAAP